MGVTRSTWAVTVLKLSNPLYHIGDRSLLLLVAPSRVRTPGSTAANGSELGCSCHLLGAGFPAGAGFGELVLVGALAAPGFIGVVNVRFLELLSHLCQLGSQRRNALRQHLDCAVRLCCLLNGLGRVV